MDGLQLKATLSLELESSKIAFQKLVGLLACTEIYGRFFGYPQLFQRFTFSATFYRLNFELQSGSNSVSLILRIVNGRFYCFRDTSR